MKVYTRSGDDGTTGLYFGGRASKDSERPSAYGALDEAQAAFGLARAEAEAGGELDEVLVAICRGLYVAMSELATLPENRRKLTPGKTMVTAEMVSEVEDLIDRTSEKFSVSAEFVIPGGNRVSAALDFARAVVRRAERSAIPIAEPESHVVPYLNRLSDLAWSLARWQEPVSLKSRIPPSSYVDP